MKVPATSVDVVLLATDGFTRLIDFYGLYTPESLLGAARERGLGALCRELRDLEDSDTEWPALSPAKTERRRHRASLEGGRLSEGVWVMVAISLPTDNRATRFPVSIKGVVSVGDRFVLLKNEREEWELPGGKLETGEDPAECLKREILEELSLDVSISRVLDCWLYKIMPSMEVVIVTYGTLYSGTAQPVLSHEHKELKLFGIEEIESLRMPSGYGASIRRWHGIRKTWKRYD